MSKDWANDIKVMHDLFQMRKTFTSAELFKYLSWRVDFLEEELFEINNADRPEEIVDGLIDICVVAIGTLDLFGIDAQKAWDAVLSANMNKVPGVNPNRKNELGLPDLMKPPGWIAPSHKGNTGLLEKEWFDDNIKLIEKYEGA